MDWTRIRDALVRRSWWLYVVLTFDPADFEGPWEAFRAAGECWDHGLRRALERATKGKLEYVATWERHRSGWPHANLLLTGPGLRSFVDDLGGVLRVRKSRTPSGRPRTLLFPRGFRRWLARQAPAAGFGRRVWAELLTPDNPDALAGYLVKLARELTGAPGGAKGDQSPTNAPKGFRRIRASRGTLPAALRAGSGEWTGALATVSSGLELPPRRRTRQAAPLAPATWSDVAEALDRKAQRDSGTWRDRWSQSGP